MTIGIVLVILTAIVPPADSNDGDSSGTTNIPKTPTIESYEPVNAVGSNARFTATVTEVSVLTSTNYHVPSVAPSYAPGPGKKYIMITVEQTNLMAETLDYPDLYWELHTSDGRVYEYDVWLKNDDRPDGIQTGAAVTYHLAYEVYTGSDPISLVWSTWPEYLDFTIPIAR